MKSGVGPQTGYSQVATSPAFGVRSRGSRAPRPAPEGFRRHEIFARLWARLKLNLSGLDSNTRNTSCQLRQYLSIEYNYIRNMCPYIRNRFHSEPGVFFYYIWTHVHDFYYISTHVGHMDTCVHLDTCSGCMTRLFWHLPDAYVCRIVRCLSVLNNPGRT